MKQIEMESISSEFVTVRILPEVKIHIKDEVKVFNSTSSLPDALKYLMKVYGEEEPALRQFAIKMIKDKEDEISIAMNSLSR